MQAIEQHPYVDQVVAALDGDSVVGTALGDDSTLEFLENEVMKMGSLAHTGIEWSRVEREALQILSDRSKDLKVLGFLMLCLQRGGNGERFALSLLLLHQVLASWWDQAWPYPGNQGQRARKMMFSQMLQRAGKHVEGLSFDGSVGDGRSFCLLLVEKLLAQAEQLALPCEPLSELKRAVSQLPRADEVSSPAASVSGAPANVPATMASAGESAPSHTPGALTLDPLTLDPGNERATRQSLLKVADLLIDPEADNPLGYQVRRFALWHSISSVPPTRDGVRTDLAAVSVDRVTEYRESLTKAANPGLWQRIEQSLSVSPFWLDGHWLSAQVASALGHEACAEAIRSDLRTFVERLPPLSELTFSDGTPFLSGEAADWLWTASVDGSTSGVGASPWELAYEQAREVVSQKGLAAGMQLMEQGLAEAREPRDRFYWRLANARLLRDAGLKALASQQIQDLHQQVHGQALEDWEPALIKQLERLA